MIKLHLDTDLGGDIDDLCALVMLLRWPEPNQLTGITVAGDTNGRRHGYVRHVLNLAGRSDIPSAAGADTAQGFYRYELGLPREERYWPEPVPPSPNPPEEAIELLKHSIDQDAIVVGIGPMTNLCLVEKAYPGILGKARLFLMGGFVYPPREGFPAWGNEMDFNFQVDVQSAQYVLQHSHPTLIPLSVTVETALRSSYLDGLRQAGPLGELITRQARAFYEDQPDIKVLMESCPALPVDIINFQHDPLACAIALGWNTGVHIEELNLEIVEKDGWLVELINPAGKTYHLVTAIDGPRFNAFWYGLLTQQPGKD